MEQFDKELSGTRCNSADGETRRAIVASEWLLSGAITYEVRLGLLLTLSLSLTLTLALTLTQNPNP